MPAPTIPTRLSAFLWHFIHPFRWRFLCTLFCSLAWAFDQTIFPYALKMLVDALQATPPSPGMMAGLAPALWFFGIVWFVAEIFYRLQGLSWMWFLLDFTAKMRMDVTRYVGGHSYGYFADHFAGAVANKISDLPRSSASFLQMLASVYIPSLVALLMACGIMATVDRSYAALLGAWFAVHIAICVIFARACDRAGEAHSETQSALQGKIVDMLSNNVNMRLFARRRYEMNYLGQYQEVERKANWQALWTTEKVRFILNINSLAGIFLLMWLLLGRWQAGNIALGDTILVLNSTFNIMMMAWMSGMQLPTLYREIGVMRQALGIIATPHGLVDTPEAGTLEVTAGEICFENVTFGYLPHRPPLFDGLNVVIPGGSRTGLVGFSGSGKSSFTHLALRFFEVGSGRILIDGQDIANVTQDSLRAQIAMIPQDTTLFHRSMMDNIRYGRPEASDAEVVEAARRAHCHEFIQQLEHGYDSTVGERGIKLSVGQRQRVAIARAILKDAPILMLDEATSALDSVTEHYIQQSLNELMEGRTSIVIAHRLSTLFAMDRILVFREGRIVEEGTHAELITQGGRYAMMWERQISGFLPETE